MENTGHFGKADIDINLPEALAITPYSTKKVGIIDGSVDGTHPDLTGNVDTVLSTCIVDPTCDWDPSHDGVFVAQGWTRHGTNMAGIIGALTNNDEFSWSGSCQGTVCEGVAGIATPGPLSSARNIVAIATRNHFGIGLIADGIDYAATDPVVNGQIPILNISEASIRRFSLKRFATRCATRFLQAY